MHVLCQYKFISTQSLIIPFSFKEFSLVSKLSQGSSCNRKGRRPGKKLTKNLPLLVPICHTEYHDKHYSALMYKKENIPSPIGLLLSISY